MWLRKQVYTHTHTHTHECLRILNRFTHTHWHKEKSSFNICLSGPYPPPSQVQEDKQRADDISLQRIESDSEHPFPLFLFHPLEYLEFSIFFISLLWLNVIFCFMFSFTCFNSLCFSSYTQKHINTPIHTGTWKHINIPIHTALWELKEH